jgi:ribose-phosphate pyrophosphokinase
MLHHALMVIEATLSSQLTVFAAPASLRLGSEICDILGTSPAAHDCRRFPDGETQVDLRKSVRGHDVYLVQSSSPPVEQHLMELLLLADACRRAGAGRLTGVVPYFGYARQDRRTDRRSLGGRVAADIIGTAKFDRLILVDTHTPAIEGFFDMPIDHLTAVPLLARAVAPSVAGNAVVVAPDLGAVKLARAYAAELHLPMAFVHKTRLDGDAVEAHGVIGDVRNRLPIVIDDMLSTGSTVEAAVGALRGAGALEPVTVVVTHGLFVGRAREVVARLPIARLIATNTVAIDAVVSPIEIASVAPLLATAIRRNHRDESLADLRSPA